MADRGLVHYRVFSRGDVPFPACLPFVNHLSGTTTRDEAAVDCPVCRRQMRG